MTSKSRDESFDGSPYQSPPDSQLSSEDELIAFAQGYFSTDFPNHERLGCPVEGTLSDVVRSGKIPDDRLLSHLFGCSECFGQYQNALAAYRAETKAAAGNAQIHSWRDKLSVANLLRPIPIFAAALSLVFAMVGAYVWREYRATREQIVLKRDSSPAAESSGNPSANNLPSAIAEASPLPRRPVEPDTSPATPKQTVPQKEPLPRQVGRASRDEELIAMTIDLRNYAATRGGANLVGGAGGGDHLTVAPARTRMTLMLPEGSSKGFYTVSIAGALGNALETRKAQSADGKTLTATLNMQKLAPDKYWLRISRQGEPPVDVPIVVRPFKRP